MAVICSFVFTQATFAVGYGTIAWAYIGELLPKDFEGLTIGSASLVNWAVSFFLTFFYHQMVVSLTFYITQVVRYLSQVKKCAWLTQHHSLQGIRLKIN